MQLWEVSADGEPQFLSTLNDAFLVQQLVSNWYYMPTGLTADGRTVVTGGSDKVIIWDIADRIRPRRATTLHGSFAALSPDGTLVGITATSGDDHDTTLWDIADRDAPRRLGTIPVDPRGWASDMSISPDNHVLVDPGTYESQLWDIRDPRHPSRLGTVPGTEVAFSHDSRLLMASARQLGSPATVWDVHDPGNPVRLHQLDGHVGAFSPDGHMAVTAGARNSSVWDVTYPAQPQRLVTVDGYIGVAFSDDGQILQAQDNDGRLVQLQIGSLAAIAADPLATAAPSSAAE